MILRGTCIICDNFLIFNSEGYLCDINELPLKDSEERIYYSKKSKSVLCPKCYSVLREVIQDESGKRK